MKPSSRTPAHPRHPVALATFLVFGLAQAATAADDALLAAAQAGQHTLQNVTVTATTLPYTHLRAHETSLHLGCRPLLE